MDAKVDPLRTHILEAVECLRQRKCRPDREAIAHYVLRKFGSSMNEIFGELENIVDEGGLIKVEYKGTTSYRSLQSFDSTNSPLLTKHSKILNSSKTTRLIVSGINELLVQDPTYSQCGVPLEELKEKLVVFDSVRFTEDTILNLLERELSCGGINVATSDFFNGDLRIFPKDIPVPDDMNIVASFFTSLMSPASSPASDKETKAKKPRKSDEAHTSSSSESKTSPSKKAKVDSEKVPTEGDAKLTKTPPQLQKKARASSTSPSVSTSARKISAFQVAEAMRKGYESTAEFESTSAQMIKLAGALIKKQTDSTQPSDSGGSSRPSLVLVSPTDGDEEGQDEDTTEDDGNAEPEHEDLLIEEEAVGEEEVDAENSAPPPTNNDQGKKKRGRGRRAKAASGSGTQSSPSSSNSPSTTPTKSEPEQKVSPVPDTGLTRSKRDKRKKQVFDPSDLPPSYSRKPVKKPRVTETVPSTTMKKPSPPQPNIPNSNKRGGRRSTPNETTTLANISKTAMEIVKQGSPSLKGKACKTITGSIDEAITTAADSYSSNLKSKQDLKSPARNRSPVRSKSPVISSEGKTKIPDVAATKKHETPRLIIAEDSTLDSISNTDAKLCSYCKTCKKEGGEAEHFLICSACSTKIHSECINYSIELYNRIQKLENGWECVECKTCRICMAKVILNPEIQSSDSSSINPRTKGPAIIFCETCDSGFHTKCIDGPDFSKSSNRSWSCNECEPLSPVPALPPSTTEPKQSMPISTKTSVTVSPSSSQQAPGVGSHKLNRTQQRQKSTDAEAQESIKAQPPAPVDEVDGNGKIDESNDGDHANHDSKDAELKNQDHATFPDDLRLWSLDDVERYFLQKGLTDEATSLRQQQVDGYNLLLLQREDIVTGMGFRLGPALKVYRLIHELQTNAPVQPHSSWPPENNEKEKSE